MKQQAAGLAGAAPALEQMVNSPNKLARRWQARSLAGLFTFWILAVALPESLGLSAAWRAFGAGLVVPGSALLYAIPPAHHPMGMAMVIGHGILIAAEAGVVAWTLRRH